MMIKASWICTSALIILFVGCKADPVDINKFAESANNKPSSDDPNSNQDNENDMTITEKIAAMKEKNKGKTFISSVYTYDTLGNHVAGGTPCKEGEVNYGSLKDCGLDAATGDYRCYGRIRLCGIRLNFNELTPETDIVVDFAPSPIDNLNPTPKCPSPYTTLIATIKGCPYDNTIAACSTHSTYNRYICAYTEKAKNLPIGIKFVNAFKITIRDGQSAPPITQPSCPDEGYELSQYGHSYFADCNWATNDGVGCTGYRSLCSKIGRL